ncbi:MAG: dihydroorotate dehydrogenase electron transfer subunit [Candidatus Lokiarchaeota archaeon]|nr:dihydroorotate dehydrogenase electron transfer subunit [Candidatus Lokiarchaeota archaeon]
MFNKIQKGWKELKEEVIDSGRCVFCGGCGAFCANIKFDKENEIPYDDGSCEEMNTCRDGYGLCYNVCPKTGIDDIPLELLDKWVFGKEKKRILGDYIDIKSVRLGDSLKQKIGSVDAGVISGLLMSAMEENQIDCAIINENDEKYRPEPKIIKEVNQIKKSVGYKPSQAPTLSLIGEAINDGCTDIAVVGTPCQIQGLRKLQNHPRFDFEAYDLVSLAIGTFCFGTFHNRELLNVLERYNVDPNEISKVEKDKSNFKLEFTTNSARTGVPLNDLYSSSIRNACFSCSDYTASFADISIGNEGSEEGWHTVIIRTERGQEIFDLAKEEGYLETQEINKDNKEIVLDITRRKIDIAEIEKIDEHSPEIRSFWIRNARITKAYQPGNFVILWLPDYDFLPMSISKIDGNLLEITVQKIGPGTEQLFELGVGDKIGIRGPFGNTWNYEDASNILVVGGGMGIAAVTSLIKPLKRNKKDVFVAIGAKNKASLIFEERLKDLIPDTLCTTDDGSLGRKCYVTDPIEEIVEEKNIDLILTCGPEVMMKRVLEIAESKGIELQASLERKMKCGVGLCGSCCIGEENKTTVCKDGPIFDLNQLKSFPQFGKYEK